MPNPSKAPRRRRNKKLEEELKKWMEEKYGKKSSAKQRVKPGRFAETFKL